MDFHFTPEQLDFKKSVIDFAQRQLNDDIVLRDKESRFSRDLWKKCADFGILSLPFPKEYGGTECDILTTLLVMEGLGYGCKDNGLIFSLNGQMWTIQMPVWQFGSDAQKKKYLTRLCSGEWIGANGMTEPGSGSDAYALGTVAERRGGGYVLNGTKTLITNAPIADVFLIFASTDRKRGFLGVSAFLIDKGTPGLRVGKPIEKMGLKTSPMSEIFLENCEVPPDGLLGREGNGSTIFNAGIEWERSCMLASDVGVMERQLEVCLKYARERRQFNTPIGKFQAVSHKIAEMKVRLETARLLLYKVAWAKKNNERAGLEAAIAKLYLSESFVKSCQDAIQIHGGYGYTTEFELERELRDAVSSTLYSGTSEIQKNIIAKNLGL